jgi:hypothetical protein
MHDFFRDRRARAYAARDKAPVGMSQLNDDPELLIYAAANLRTAATFAASCRDCCEQYRAAEA